ncbi:alginate export family protein [Flavitalea antarctica]
MTVLFAFLNEDSLIAQEADTSTELSIQLELRPRAEYRYNFIYPPQDTLPEFFNVTQRNRLSVLYARRKWLLKSDFQEIHYWDKNEGSKAGSINFYQLYLESKFNGVNLRVGRQGVLLDNGRIFSDAPWAQQSRAHEGIRFMKYSKKFRNDLFLLFTRKYSNEFDPAFSPVIAHRYKYLVLYHLSFRPNMNFSFNSINAMDVFRDENGGADYARFTTGGRVELSNKQWYSTLNGFVQFGRDPRGKKLLAWYIQPELRLTINKNIFRVGAEFLSGSGPGLSPERSGDFDVLYGVAWKFMGNMNIFTRFPPDVAGNGLINPYFFILIPIVKNLAFRSDFHLFFSQHSPGRNTGQTTKKYLGFENDLSFRYIPLTNIEVNYGFSFFKSSSAMKFLPKIQDENKMAYWSYLMISCNLNILDSKRYNNRN